MFGDRLKVVAAVFLVQVVKPDQSVEQSFGRAQRRACGARDFLRRMFAVMNVSE